VISPVWQPTAVTPKEWRLMMAAHLMLVRCPREELISAEWWPTTLTPEEWYWMVAVRLTLRYFPDRVPGLEKSLAPLLNLVDAAMAEAAIGKCELTTQFFVDLEKNLEKKVWEGVWREAIQTWEKALASAQTPPNPSERS
jgi:hypothetical protein